MPYMATQVEEQLAAGEFTNMGEVVAEIQLVYDNAKKFNSPGMKTGNKTAAEICDAARYMEGKLREKLVRRSPAVPLQLQSPLPLSSIIAQVRRARKI